MSTRLWLPMIAMVSALLVSQRVQAQAADQSSVATQLSGLTDELKKFHADVVKSATPAAPTKTDPVLTLHAIYPNASIWVATGSPIVVAPGENIDTLQGVVTMLYPAVVLAAPLPAAVAPTTLPKTPAAVAPTTQPFKIYPFTSQNAATTWAGIINGAFDKPIKAVVDPENLKNVIVGASPADLAVLDDLLKQRIGTPTVTGWTLKSKEGADPNLMAASLREIAYSLQIKTIGVARTKDNHSVVITAVPDDFNKINELFQNAFPSAVVVFPAPAAKPKE